MSTNFSRPTTNYRKPEPTPQLSFPSDQNKAPNTLKQSSVKKPIVKQSIAIKKEDNRPKYGPPESTNKNGEQLKIFKKVEQLKEEVEKCSLRRGQDVVSLLQQAMDLLREDCVNPA